MENSNELRELLGKVESRGQVYEIRMPILRDLIESDLSYIDKDLIYALGAFSLGISKEEFYNWPINDAMKVLRIMCSAIETL